MTRNTEGSSEGVGEKMESFRFTEDQETNSMIVEPVQGESERSTQVSASKAEQVIRHLVKDPKNRLALSALSANDPSAILRIPSAILSNAQTFNISIPNEGAPITNQRSSGRCWIFAATNVFRVAMMKKYNLAKFELSQSYLFFWDKVEKANYFLENILETADEDVESRIVSTLMIAPVNDGGQWDMLANLVKKYGIVPQTAFPDSWNAQNSRTFDTLLTTKLREDGLVLRKLVADKASASKISEAKDEMMKEIVGIVTLSLGVPPASDEKLTWEFYDKDKKFQSVTTTPLELADGLHDTDACGGTDVLKLFSLVHDPRNEYYKHLTVDRLGNVWGGRPITYVNVDKEVMKEACIEMLKKGFPIFFGSDVGKYSDRKSGIMDTHLVDYELGFNVKLGMTKAERLLTGESLMTHAMVLTAVHVDSEGKSVRWRVENSWSETAGTEGYFVMSDRWMDEFCYQAVVDPSVVSDKVKKVLDQKAHVMPLWDPLGALA